MGHKEPPLSEGTAYVRPGENEVYLMVRFGPLAVRGVNFIRTLFGKVEVDLRQNTYWPLWFFDAQSHQGQLHSDMSRLMKLLYAFPLLYF